MLAGQYAQELVAIVFGGLIFMDLQMWIVRLGKRIGVKWY